MNEAIDKTFGRGWAFPPSFTPQDGVAMVAGAEDVRQSLRILFSTLPGERVLRENYGCDLNQFMFANINAGLLAAIKSQIADSVLAHEHRAQVEGVQIAQHPDAPNRLRVQVDYRLSGTDTPLRFDGQLDMLDGWGVMS